MKTLSQNSYNCRVIILLVLLILPCYVHVLNASWHLDDYLNIVDNSRIQMNTLSLEDIKDSFFANPRESDKPYRPVAMLSFALNWYQWQGDVSGYRLVNITIHAAVAFFLFLTVLKLFSTPQLQSFSREDAFFVALLAAALWAIHPIQIQAVTYIVQRMASLAALFYIIGVWAYVTARLSHFPCARIFFYAGCLLAYFLAFYSKENAVLLPATLILIELSFFQNLKHPFTKWCFRALVAGGAVLVLAAFLYALSGGWADSFSYYRRDFEPIERLMTQLRVVLFYLWQIIYPVPEQFSITHDFPVSRSFFEPLTTIASLIFISVMSAFSLWALHKSPAFKIVGFSILFFFLNHIVEASFLSLEMVFEHRNYLPSLFLFVPVAIGIKYGFDYYREKNEAMFGFLVLAVCALLVGVGVSTYVRNLDWRTTRSLWQDAMIKAPNSARPLQNLASGYYSPTGQVDKAIAFYQQAIHLSDNSIGFEAISYFNIANVYYLQLHEYEKAIEYAQKALKVNPDHPRAGYLLAAAKASLGRHEEALSGLKKRVQAEAIKSASNLHFKGLLYLKIQQPENALAVFRRCQAQAPNHWRYLREIGFSLYMMHQYDQASWFFRRVKNMRPNQPENLMGLSAASLAKGKPNDAEGYVEQWVRAVGADNVESYLEKAIKKGSIGPPVPYDRLMPLISKVLKKKEVDYKETANRMDAIDFGDSY